MVVAKIRDMLLLLFTRKVMWVSTPPVSPAFTLVLCDKLVGVAVYATRHKRKTSQKNTFAIFGLLRLKCRKRPCFFQATPRWDLRKTPGRMNCDPYVTYARIATTGLTSGPT